MHMIFHYGRRPITELSSESRRLARHRLGPIISYYIFYPVKAKRHLFHCSRSNEGQGGRRYIYGYGISAYKPATMETSMKINPRDDKREKISSFSLYSNFYGSNLAHCQSIQRQCRYCADDHELMLRSLASSASRRHRP